MNPQMQSAFFTVLNKDIRYEIYKYLFGCQSVNIESRSPLNPDPFPCPWSRTQNGLLDCCTWKDYVVTVAPVTPALKTKRRAHHKHTSMLGTCQRVYMEGIRVLYSTNTIRFFDDHGLGRWKAGIQALRWELVRSVDLRVRLAPDLWQWDQAWETMRSMPGLRLARLRCERHVSVYTDTWGPWFHAGWEDVFGDEGVFLPWALDPVLRPRMSDEARFEILVHDEMRERLRVLVKEMRARGVRGIVFGWVDVVLGFIVKSIEWEEV
ncbi:hypothetical protein ACHAPT_012081 [Fusarium lateritium]